MATAYAINQSTGDALYGLIIKNNLYRNSVTGLFEVYVSGNYQNYAHGLGYVDSSRNFGLTLPPLTNGDFKIEFRKQLSALPDEFDPSMAIDSISLVDGMTVSQALQLILASVGGILSGATGNIITLKNPSGSQTKLVVTTDTNGNRTLVIATPE